MRIFLSNLLSIEDEPIDINKNLIPEFNMGSKDVIGQTCHLEMSDMLPAEVEKLRLLAEMENLRKRTDKERIDSIRYGSINLARDILFTDDNLTRALDALLPEEEKSETINNLIDGLRMVQREFSNILEKHGVQKIKALNMKFDHNFHQAMIEIENDEVEEGTVIKEMQSGYTMHERLLRPSMVGVAKKSINNSDDKKNDDKNN